MSRSGLVGSALKTVSVSLPSPETPAAAQAAFPAGVDLHVGKYRSVHLKLCPFALLLLHPALPFPPTICRERPRAGPVACCLAAAQGAEGTSCPTGRSQAAGSIYRRSGALPW